MSIKNVISNIEKKYGKEAIAQEVRNVEFISTTSYKIDSILGGGFPKGRVVELFGWESSGKSTLATLAAISVQKQGKAVGYVDMEQAFDMNYARDLGLNVNPDKFILSQPDNGEQGIEIMREMVKSNEIGLVIGDSVSAFIPKAVIEGEAGESKMGLHARMMSSMLPVLVKSLKGSDCTIVFINQFREKINSFGFGDNKTTSGGNALKFYASQRLEIIRIGDVKDGDENIIGQKLKVKVRKNKVYPPYKIGETKLIYGVGIDTIGELIELSIENGLIEKNGSWYNYIDSKGEKTKLGQGELLVKTILSDNPELIEEIKERLKLK